jgi:hypothetical protein
MSSHSGDIIMATIETRRNNDGTTTYRAKVRLKGCPIQSATLKGRQMRENGLIKRKLP